MCTRALAGADFLASVFKRGNMFLLGSNVLTYQAGHQCSDLGKVSTAPPKFIRTVSTLFEQFRARALPTIWVKHWKRKNRLESAAAITETQKKMVT